MKAYVLLMMVFLSIALLSVVGVVRNYPTASATPTPQPAKSPSPSPSAKPNPSATPAPRPTATHPACTVTTGSRRGTVNIRSGPGMTYPVIGYAVEGQQLEIIEALPSGWAKIETGYFFIERWCK